jgi:hypothetical protein
MKGFFSKNWYVVIISFFWIVISLIHFCGIYILFVIILKVTYFLKKVIFISVIFISLNKLEQFEQNQRITGHTATSSVQREEDKL